MAMFAPTSWSRPGLAMEVTGSGATRIFEAICKHKPDAKFYQASTSGLFEPGNILRGYDSYEG
jgi:GDPmannose 4,6-dehydratase